MTARRNPTAADDGATMRVRASWEQLRELNRRAGLGVFDGRARGEYVLGSALGEPHDELLERVHEIARADRAEFEAERADRARKRGGPATAGPPVTA
jgi:hypothetical protein